jgi:hypothetical protein
VGAAKPTFYSPSVLKLNPNTNKEFGNFLFSSLRYQLNAFQIKLIRFYCLTLKYKEKAREDKIK